MKKDDSTWPVNGSLSRPIRPARTGVKAHSNSWATLTVPSR